jgi:uncharacterized protein DUF4407
MDASILEQRKTLDPITRLLARLAGADADMLAQCPARDIDNVRNVSAIMILVWLIQTGVFAVVAHMMLARPGQFRPELIVAAGLLATLILLMDSAMIMRAAWAAQGIDELARGGLNISRGWGNRIKSGLLLTVRLAISFVLSALMAVFLSILLFETDVNRELDGMYQEQNAALFADAAGRVDERLRKNVEIRDEIRSGITRTEQEEKDLRPIIIDPMLEEPELKVALERVARLEAAKAAADADLVKAQEFSTHELAGKVVAPGNSGVPGAGPVRRAAEERVAIATRSVEAAAEALSRAQAQVGELRKGRTDAAERRSETAQARLAEVFKRRQAEEAKLAELEDEHRRLSAGREETIRASVESSPTHLPKNEGFLARVRALDRLTRDRVILSVVILFELAWLAIELAAVFTKIATFVPATYARMLAAEDYGQAVKTAHDVASKINSYGPPQDPAGDEPEEDVPEFEAGGADAAASGAPPEQPSPDLKDRLNTAMGASATREAAKQRPEAEQADGAQTAGARPAAAPHAPRPRGRPPGPKWRPHVVPPEGEAPA